MVNTMNNRIFVIIPSKHNVWTYFLKGDTHGKIFMVLRVKEPGYFVGYFR